MKRQFYPTNTQEAVIEAILIDNGYEAKEIEFHGTFPNRFVRIGYWSRLDTKTQLQLSDTVHEDSFEDDDTLDGFLYHIILQEM